MFTQNYETQNISFAMALDMWLLSNKVHIKHSTFDKYSYIIERHIIPTLGDFPISTLNAVKINEFLNDKLNSGGIESGEPLAPSYVGTMSLIISSTIQFAANENYCAQLKNPIFKPTNNTSNFHILERKDCLRLTNHIAQETDETGLGILLALYMGLRIGEVCALKWDDIDFRKNLIWVHSTVSRVKNGDKTEYIVDTPKTKSSIRLIPIPKKITGFIKEIYSQRKSDYVISDKQTFVIPRSFEYRYHKTLKQLGIESINFHSLRHTFATNCIANGMDVKSLSEILGHANTNTTMQIYVHPSMDVKRKQINKVFQ